MPPHKKSPFKYVLVFLLCWLPCTSTFAEIYKWTDEHGQTHFGDRPPQNRQSTDISHKLQNINISSGLSSPEMMLEHERLKAEEKQRLVEAKEQHQNRLQEMSLACKQARQALKKLKGRVVFLDGQGKEIKVSEVERKQQALEMEAAVRTHCQ